jgi:hypothetical protein
MLLVMSGVEIYYYYINIFSVYIYELDFELMLMLGLPTQMYCEELVVQHIYMYST